MYQQKRATKVDSHWLWLAWDVLYVNIFNQDYHKKCTISKYMIDWFFSRYTFEYYFFCYLFRKKKNFYCLFI